MAKDLSMMILTCVVPTPSMHKLDDFLEQAGAREITWRPYRINGAGVAHDASAGTVARSEKQQEWLKHHVKGDMKATDIKQAWMKAGFTEHTVYGALSRAVQNKILKKVRPGHYRGM